MPDTLEYYQEVLGFTLDWAWPAEDRSPVIREAWVGIKWAAMSRDDTRFMFTLDLGTSSGPFIAEKGNGIVLYIIVDDVAALYAECVVSGAMVVQELHDFAGRLQFSIGDPNGYVLAFSQAFA